MPRAVLKDIQVVSPTVKPVENGHAFTVPAVDARAAEVRLSSHERTPTRS